MRNWLICLLATLSLLVPMSIGVWAQGSGVIEGQVLNATPGGATVENVTITLWILDGQEQKVLQEETTDGEGKFRFQGLDTEGYSYQLQVDHQGVSYWSDVATFSEGEDTLSIPVTVYDTTTDDADLWVEKAHLILDFQAGTILLQEVQILLNNGNKTYVSPGGEGGETIHFPLPQGAANLQLMKGMMACCVAQTEKGFAYTRPVFPGVQEFFFSYELPYQSPSYTLSKEIAYPTSSLDVLVADVGVEVTAPGLTAQEPLSLQGRRYLHLTGQGLTPADGLTLVFNNLPVETRPAEPATTASAPGVLAKVVMGLGTVAVLLALAYPFLKRRHGEES